MKRRSEKTKKISTKYILTLFFISLMLGILLYPIIISTLAVIRPERLIPQREAKKAYQICNNFKTNLYRDKPHCYSSIFNSLTKKTDTEFAFDTIYELQKLDKYADGCHVIAHGIGWAAYDKYPNKFKETLKNISKTCSAGAVHGLIERYSTHHNGSFDKSIIPEICGNNPPLGCVHAVGHILLVQTENNLEQATDFCSIYPLKNNRRRSCLTGIYMERMIGPNLYDHGMISKERRTNWYTHFDEFDALCHQAKGENALACWEKVALPASIKYKDDPIKLMQYCDTAQLQEATNNCKTIGIAEILIRHSYNLQAYKPFCELSQTGFPAFKNECYAALVKVTMLSLPPEKLKRVGDFCSSLAQNDQLGCIQAINESFTRLSASPTYIGRVCGFVQKEYRSACLNKTAKADNNLEDKNVNDIHMLPHKI